jgi:RNA polymerase sigma factor (sigma-70 family)
MQSTDDSALLRQFAENNSDEAFATLVQRHVNLVYSVALRQVGNPHHAEEITQAVFIILARKAAQLRHQKALSSWLFQTTRLTTNNFLRSETRRLHREQEAYMQSVLNESGDDVWPKIAPMLDGSIARLREKDRQAILLRFYEGKNLREVGAALGANEAAAEKRVNRALEKLRRSFCKRGVSSTGAIIAGAISANSVQAAPAMLAKTVAAMAIAKRATASVSTLTLIKGASKIMAWTKTKTAVVVGVVLILACGTTITVSKKLSAKSKPAVNTYQRGNLTDPKYRDVIANLRANVWPKERQLAEEKIKARQQINETVNAVTINLKPYVNAALNDSPASRMGNYDGNLEELPSGIHIFGGVPFDVQGLIQLDGTNMLQFKKRFPVSADNITINQKCNKFYLFHGANWIYGRDFGKTVAKLVVHYGDGSAKEIEIVAGQHIFDWWSPLFTTGVDPRYLQMAEGTERAWSGSNPLIKDVWPDESLVLYKSTFKNPRPEIVVSSLDYVSTQTGTAPFLVGLTVE